MLRKIETITSAELDDSLRENQVESSNIYAISYDAEKEILYVQFESRFGAGAIYKYLDVPLEIYAKFWSAPSKGKYFHRFVKDKYTYKRL